MTAAKSSDGCSGCCKAFGLWPSAGFATFFAFTEVVASAAFGSDVFEVVLLDMATLLMIHLQRARMSDGAGRSITATRLGGFEYSAAALAVPAPAKSGYGPDSIRYALTARA
jgi:hypothetical protein